jgi:hypothetical protein
MMDALRNYVTMAVIAGTDLVVLVALVKVFSLLAPHARRRR